MARRKKTDEAAVVASDAPDVVNNSEPTSSSAAAETVTLVGTQIEGLAPCARLFGVDANTLRGWVEKKGCPFVKRAVKRGDAWIFDISAVHKWILEYSVNKAIEERGGPAEGDDGGAEWEIRQKAAMAQLAELKLAQAYGVLIHMDDAVAEREMADAEVRTALLDMPGRYADALSIESDPTKCMHILKKAVDGVLTKLVLIFEDAPDGFQDDAAAAATGEDDDGAQ